MRIKIGERFITQRTEFSRYHLEDINGEKIKTKEAEDIIENYFKQLENPDLYFRIEDNRIHWLEYREVEYMFLPKIVEKIEPYAFRDNHNIKLAVLGENTDIIQAYAFSGCTKLTEVILPRNLKVIQQYAFSDCERLETIYYEGTKKEWQIIHKDRYWRFGNSADIIAIDGIVE